MAHVSEIFSVEELEKQIAEGNVTRRKHPDYDLYILNYSESVQYSREWNPVTLNCRGLILDEKMNIVARPWEKFFNFGEYPIDLSGPIEATDKKDGSLGILYGIPNRFNVPHEHAIATRGSFASEQAIHATRIWNERYAPFIEPLSTFTYLFEIVYPSNRIVLDYGDMDDLILLGAVHKAGGYYVGPIDAARDISWTGPVTEVFAYETLAECLEVHRANAEGLVIRAGNSMVKVKQADYVALHKLIFNLNEKTVWENLRNGETVAMMCERLPDEFHGFVKDTAADLLSRKRQLEDEILAYYIGVIQSLPGGFTQKDFALLATKTPYPSYLFTLLKCQSIDGALWKAVEPKMVKA